MPSPRRLYPNSVGPPQNLQVLITLTSSLLVLQGPEWGCFIQLIILITSAFLVPSTPVHPIPYIKFSMSKYLVLFQFFYKSLTGTYGQSFQSSLDYENKGHILGMAEQLAGRSLHPHLACGASRLAWPGDFWSSNTEENTFLCGLSYCYSGVFCYKY